MEGRELIYVFEGNVVSAVDAGVPLNSILAPGAVVPKEGLRVDVSFAGKISEGRLKGAELRGTDFLTVRADGKSIIELRCVITTHDGARIMLSCNGVCLPGNAPGLLRVKEGVSLFTNDARYSDLNLQLIWAEGEVDLAKGTLKVTGYKA